MVYQIMSSWPSAKTGRAEKNKLVYKTAPNKEKMEIKVSTSLKELTWRGTTNNKYFSIHTGLAAAKRSKKQA
jgi:hypothetical protein